MYQELQQQLDIQFTNEELLKRAFVHRSYLNEHRQEVVMSNERLEYLGDAVLELSVTQALFHKLPDASEGKLTSIRSALVRGEHLSEIARRLDLGAYLQLSVGEENSGGRDKDYILANTFEALIGALYLDQGFAVADAFILKYVFCKLEYILEQNLHIDAKTEFQEIAQAEVMITPEYQLLEESGPDHNKVFVMGAYINDKLVGKGGGSSKRKAQEEAARTALNNVDWSELRDLLMRDAA